MSHKEVLLEKTCHIKRTCLQLFQFLMRLPVQIDRLSESAGLTDQIGTKQAPVTGLPPENKHRLPPKIIG